MNAEEHHRQIIWRSRRGMLELDRFLLPFAKARFMAMTDDDQQCYESLLEQPDPVLLNWLTGDETPEPQYSDLIQAIRQYARTHKADF